MALAPVSTPAADTLDAKRPAPRTEPRDRSWRQTLNRHLLRLPFYLLAITMIFPFYWMVISVLKTPQEITEFPPTFVPENPQLDSFYDPDWNATTAKTGHQQGILQRFEVTLGFWRFMLNSLVVTAAITVGALLIASLAAYVITKHRIRGRRVIFLMIVASMMVPWQTTLVPNYVIMRNLGWLDSYAGYIVPALAKAFVLFFLVQFLHSIPDELIHAARVDGAGEWRIWWQVVMPLLRPALAAMSIFLVLWEWNNLLWPLIIIDSDAMANLPVAMARLNSHYPSAIHQGAIMAGGLIASLPPLIFFLIFQRYFTKGIILSGVKG